MKTCLAIVGTLTGFARFFAFAIVALVVATQSLAESSKCDAKDVATIPEFAYSAEMCDLVADAASGEIYINVKHAPGLAIIVR